jgi:hypothetical protein
MCTSSRRGAQLTVPVTDRGDAIRVIDVALPRYPDEQAIAAVAATAHARVYACPRRAAHAPYSSTSSASSVGRRVPSGTWRTGG